MSPLDRSASARRRYFSEAECNLADFRQDVEQVLEPAVLTFTDTVERNIPVYDVPALSDALADAGRRRGLLAEWNWILSDASGALVLRRAYSDTSAIDAATAIYDRVIADEKASSGGGADHFAKAGANDRIWNSLQKLCMADPKVFALYFGNPAIDAVCQAWLGPGYQMTAQVNVVRPGGEAQQAHRDYHLGFQTADTAAAFPLNTHLLSASLTLQGGIAHCDAPIESGPTKLLPFSQRYAPGYLAWRRDDFRSYFEDHCVQLPLAKGDAVFFNPALFHAAGANQSANIQRMVNLLQVSSPFGRAMESMDREGMIRLLFPVLRSLVDSGRIDQAERDAAIAASAEGYAFPTNLDSDPPVGGLAPETQADLLRRALDEGMTEAVFSETLAAQTARRLP